MILKGPFYPKPIYDSMIITAIQEKNLGSGPGQRNGAINSLFMKWKWR